MLNAAETPKKLRLKGKNCNFVVKNKNIKKVIPDIAREVRR